MNHLRHLLILLAFVGCTSSTKPQRLPIHMIRPELNIGEYLQRGESNSLYTFVRDLDSPLKGLVRINLSSDEISVIDSSADSAMDLKVQDTWIVYRKNAFGFVLINKIPMIFATSIERIRFIESHDKQLKIFVDHNDHTHSVITIDETGTVLQQKPLMASPRALIYENERYYLVSQSKSGLEYSSYSFESDQVGPPQIIEPGELGSYVSARVYSGKVWIAYLAEDSGLLRLASRSFGEKNFQLTTIDGIPDQTMRGMDIEFFEDGENLGIIYLDAWTLKLRMARFLKGQWRAEQLLVTGAVGFYTQQVDAPSGHLRIATHNFRTDSDSLHPTFEDLAIVDVF